jgi:hypothetical protein
MSSFKQLLVNAIIKVTHANPSLDRPDGPSATEARDEFIASLVAELFPENTFVHIKKSKVAEASPVVEKKKRGPMSDEAKAAMKAKRDATIAAKSAGNSPVAAEVKPTKAKKAKVDPVPEGTGTLVADPEPKKSPKAKKVKEEKSPKAKKVKEEKSPKAKKVKEAAEEKTPKAKKAAVAEDANLQKIDPTWRKHLKKAAGDKYAKEQEAGLLTFLNALDKAAFDAKRAEDHVKEFLAQSGPADGKVEAEVIIVEFNGKEYYVNPETKRVYEGEGEYDDETETWTTMKAVGYAGMAAFADMELE